MTIATSAVHLPAITPTSTEAHAALVALHGSFLQRMRVVLAAGRRLLADPDQTREVFVLAIALNAKKLPELLARFVGDDRGLELLLQDANIDGKSVDFSALRALGAHTLGGAYARFLDDNGLDPDLFQAPPGLPRAAAYLAKRLRQSHDLWHVLTGHAPDVAGEVALQAFTFAQTRMPSAALIAIAGVLRWSIVRPSLVLEAWRAYRRGARAAFLAPVRWEQHWERPLVEVRRELGL